MDRVRKTYVSTDQLQQEDYKLDEAFLHDAFRPIESPDLDSPPIFTVSALSVDKCLLASEIFKMDNIQAQDPACDVAHNIP
ncbi:hypothetical protein DXG01_009132 [Tephrocybe rancida]|nr:hypothetical protein DXG01_009132 [Tephrocybe rancida]